jgi:hypothetical protein
MCDMQASYITSGRCMNCRTRGSHTCIGHLQSSTVATHIISSQFMLYAHLSLRESHRQQGLTRLLGGQPTARYK